MVEQVKIYREGQYIFLPIQQFVNEYRQNLPTHWHLYMNDVNEGINIKTDEDYRRYLERTHMVWFNYTDVQYAYENLKHSNYNYMFEDDILRYIAYMYGMGYFKKMGYDDLIQDLDKWLNVKNVFRPDTPPDEGFSLMDLIPLKYGQNAIRHELVFAPKWW